MGARRTGSREACSADRGRPRYARPAMQQLTQGLYLEPGEVAVLADAVRLAAGRAGLPHARWPLLRQLAQALEPLAVGAGAVVRAASSPEARATAAQALGMEPEASRQADRARGQRPSTEASGPGAG